MVKEAAAPPTAQREKDYHLQPVLVLHRQEHRCPHLSLQGVRVTRSHGQQVGVGLEAEEESKLPPMV